MKNFIKNIFTPKTIKDFLHTLKRVGICYAAFHLADLMYDNSGVCKLFEFYGYKTCNWNNDLVSLIKFLAATFTFFPQIWNMVKKRLSQPKTQNADNQRK